MKQPGPSERSLERSDELRAGQIAPADRPGSAKETPDAASILLGRLFALRRVIRRRLFGYGVFAVLAGGIAAFLTVVTLDWMVRLPPLLRVFGSLCFVGGFLASSWHWVLVPLRARVNVDELAATLEPYFEPLHDRLSSTVNFLATGEAVSSRMAREVVDCTVHMVRTLRLESALSVRPLAVRGAVFASGLLALTMISAAAPHWTLTGIRRYVNPFGPTEWPRAVQIEPITGDQTIAIGDSATIRARIVRGASASLRPVVRLRTDKDATSMLALTRESNDVYSMTLDAVTEGLRYWFEAGDDSTVAQASRIRVVPRPEIMEATARFDPPPYVPNRAARVLDLSEGPAIAVAGSEVTIFIRASKPVSIEPGKGKNGLRRDDGAFIPLEPESTDPQRLRTAFTLTANTTFRAELFDAEGFENRGSSSYSIRVVPDAPPTVTVLAPPAVVEVTPHGTVELVVRAEDDFGVQNIGLEIESPRGGDPLRIDLTPQARISAGEQGVGADVSYPWRLENLQATPGEVFSYVATVTDNRGGRADSGQTTRSSVMRLKFVSEAELELRVREDLALIEARLRQATMDQSENRDRTAALVHSEDTPLSAREAESATSVANFQGRLSRQLRELSARLQNASRRLVMNGIGDRDSINRVQTAATSVESIAMGPVAMAGAALERTHGVTDAPKQQEEVRSANQAQDATVDQLHSVIRELSQWGAFQGVLSRARELLDRQGTLQSNAGELGRSLLGKTIESLSPKESAALRRLQREQDQLAGDVDQQLARMQQLSETLKDKDPSGSESVEAGLRAARALDTVKHARSAAKDIEGNRTAAATIEQKAVADALRKMIDALRERESRELAELRKKIDRAEEEVSALIEEQNQIRAATTEAAKLQSPAEAFIALAENETTLERNARLLGDDIAEMEKAGSAGRFVRESATPMHSAAESLSQREGDRAADRENEAIDLLRKALDELQAVARHGEEEQFKRTLDHIEEEMSALLADQTAINQGIGVLRDAIQKAGKLDRSTAREATRLARTQGELRTKVDDLLPDVRQVAVYQWALQRVGHWMETSRTALEGRQVDDDLIVTTDRIVRELRKLLGAIADTRSLPFNSEFTEAEGAGDGNGSGTQSVPVPTVAELIVLRTMQNDINVRTRDLASLTGAGEPSESDLRTLEAIGEDQAEVRRLTEMVTKKSHSGSPGSGG